MTVTETVGTSEKHTDVSLRYIFKGDSSPLLENKGLDFKKEFADYQWLSYDEILALPIHKFDLHMHRFVLKLKKL